MNEVRRAAVRGLPLNFTGGGVFLGFLWGQGLLLDCTQCIMWNAYARDDNGDFLDSFYDSRK